MTALRDLLYATAVATLTTLGTWLGMDVGDE
jgi:hypothetical protein